MQIGLGRDSLGRGERVSSSSADDPGRIEGNWFGCPPGAADSVNDGFPGANGNYTNGQTTSLLGMSAICQGGVNAANARQNTHGIHSGCE